MIFFMRITRPPRQERSRQTQEALLDAAEELGTAKPYDQISVQEIASKAGFTIGAFYARFPSKGALLRGLMDRYESMIDQARARLAAVDPDELVEQLAAALLAAYQADTGRMRLLESALHTDDSLASRFEATRAAVLEFIVDTLRRACPLPRQDLETAALLLVLPLRELHYKKEFWPKQGTRVETLTARVIEAVVAFLKTRHAAAVDTTLNPQSNRKRNSK
jgi:AcrR family transcriptional regulator